MIPYVPHEFDVTRHVRPGNNNMMVAIADLTPAQIEDLKTAVRWLRAQGASVRVLDNFSTGKRENLEALTRQFGGNRLDILEGDVRNVARVEQAVRGVEVIFHEAAFVSVPQSMQEPQACFDVNIMGTSLLFEAALPCQPSSSAARRAA